MGSNCSCSSSTFSSRQVRTDKQLAVLKPMPTVSKDDINAIKAFPEISNVEYDEPLLCFDINEDESYSVTIPDRYPNASAEYYGPGISGELSAGNIVAMVRELLHLRASGLRPQANNEEDSDEEGMHSQETTLETNDGDLMARQDSSGLACELESDLTKLRARHDVFHVTIRGYAGGMQFIEWQMHVRDLVTESVASAWGMSTAAPIDVLFKVSNHYLDGKHAPTVEMKQRGKHFPFGQQMSRILNAHLRQHWPRGFPTSETNANIKPAAHDIQKRSRADVSFEKPTAAQNAVLLSLCEMGFKTDDARRAAMNSKNLDEAIEYITSPKALEPVISSQQVASAASVGALDSNIAGKAFSAPESTRYNPLTDPNKQCPMLPKGGLMCHVIDLLSKRTGSISKYCVLCDQPHVFASNMLRPAVCSREMCVYQFQELHIGSDSAESVATDAGVVDLLISIFRNAALSSRASAILLPFPSVAHPKDKKVLVLDPAKPNFDKVKEVLQHFPTTREVVRCNDLHDLKVQLEQKEPLVYPLLEWVIASNRSHLIQMDPSAQISAMGTPHQFLLLTAPPEKEAIFRERKAKHGTKFAFHGSRAENWHGILRNGLKNMSGTANQVNGSAHGSGVYFAPLASASFGYSAAGGGALPSKGGAVDGESFLGNNMMCIALCEIIDDGCIKDHGWCWTVTEEPNIMTRFFFAYSAGPSESASKAQTSDKSFMDDVQRAMKFYSL